MTLRHFAAFGVLACWVAAGCTAPSDASVPATPAPQASEAEGAEAAAADEAEAPTPDDAPAAAPSNAPSEAAEVAQGEARYPALRFEMLPEQAQGRFIELASAELCPCEGTVASLDACLKDENVCEMGVQVAALMMQLIVGGMDSVEITDTVQSFVENMRRVHTFALDDTPYQGAEEPDVVIVEFSDFECPHCARMSAMWPELLETYGDRVRVYHKQFPLGSHRNAAAASTAALAAHRQGRFVPFHDLVFEHQAQLQLASDPTPLFLEWAEACGLNIERFQTDMADPALAEMVSRDRAEGLAAGIQSTPTIFLNGVMVLDGYEESALRARIDAALP